MSNDGTTCSFLKVPLVLYEDPLPEASLEESIARHIDLILHSQKKSSEASPATGEYYPGEFPFDPEFGFDIWDTKDSAVSAQKMFSDNTRLARSVFNTLKKKEKRLEIQCIELYPLMTEDEAAKITGVRVIGKIRQTGKSFKYESGRDLILRGCTVEKTIRYPEE